MCKHPGFFDGDDHPVAASEITVLSNGPTCNGSYRWQQAHDSNNNHAATFWWKTRSLYADGPDLLNHLAATALAACGNGQLDPGEACDDGNDAGGDCCTATCELEAAGTACADDGNPCTLDQCDGTSATCQHPAGNAGASCRAQAGVCDVAETCTGTSPTCPPDAFAPATTQCRVSADVCDVAESCSGTSATCPPNGFASPAVQCRPPAGDCDVAESCTGASAACPADELKSSGTVCRPSAGPCDVAESCTGTSAACPADAFQSGATTCRPSAGTCDVAESCTGASAACPGDAFASSATVCRPSAGVCDVAESCTGSSAACPTDARSTAACRASAGDCDVAELCDGIGNDCPPDAFAPATQLCRAAHGVCDVAETCTGSSATCPLDAFAPATSLCRLATSDCDAAERCTGSSPSCPIDALQPDGTACDDGMTCTIDDRCVGGTCGGDSMICGDGVVEASCGEACDDGNTTSGDGCSATCQTEFVCGAAPRLDCRRPVAPLKSKIALKDRTPDRGDSLGWKWTKGATTPKADFGSPTTTTDYLLCIYDDGRGLVMSASAPADQLCAGRPCWRETGSGFTYKDKDATPDGLTQIVLKQGTVPGKAKVVVKGKGVNLPLATLPMTQPVTVQLRNSDGACWEALYSGPPQKNDSTQYQDKSD